MFYRETVARKVQNIHNIGKLGKHFLFVIGRANDRFEMFLFFEHVKKQNVGLSRSDLQDRDRAHLGIFPWIRIGNFEC